ncbi:hypothetical protein AMAG_06488 [Allomyces macrogynus ATCC 38327]|uniref:Uncharacterized protein n=1 Tax=Allomyces macrogynus (strain ATCC 38327) TaxID=578462 RepID=A0A0L0SGP0_ALLM3|nr:hypothetical protein AMAG_06488 [Allomyces macrogynus ATCC 38327]|eukprot:KNE61683.1 hypothetical protein AMAG_06488 [Allomyces macrogynus ATCC 38327]
MAPFPLTQTTPANLAAAAETAASQRGLFSSQAKDERMKAYKYDVAFVTAPRMLAGNGISLALSLLLFGMSARHYWQRRSSFYLAVLGLAVVFLSSDIYYFATFAMGNLEPYLLEEVRAALGMISGAHISGTLRLFLGSKSCTTFARWYTTRLRNALLAFNYALCLGALCILIWLFSTDSTTINVDSLRAPIVTTVLAWAIFADGAINLLTFLAVYSIQKRLGRDASAHRRHQIREVLILVCVITISATTSLIYYNIEKNPWGQIIMNIDGRFYSVLALVIWYLIVQIVRNRNRSVGTGSSSGTTSDSKLRSASGGPGSTGINRSVPNTSSGSRTFPSSTGSSNGVTGPRTAYPWGNSNPTSPLVPSAAPLRPTTGAAPPLKPVAPVYHKGASDIWPMHAMPPGQTQGQGPQGVPQRQGTPQQQHGQQHGQWQGQGGQYQGGGGGRPYAGGGGYGGEYPSK